MKRLLAVMTVLVLVFGFGVMASAATINFDDVASGAVVNNQYVGLGVTFSTALPSGGNVIALTPSGTFFPAESSPNIVTIGGTTMDGFNQVTNGVIRADFTALQTSVSIDVNVVSVAEQIGNEPRGTAYLQAFDSLNNQLDIATKAGVFGSTGYSTLTVSGADIARVFFSVDYGGALSFVRTYGFFDNFTFGDGVNPPPPPPPPPPPVPEPGTMMLLGSGLVGLVGYGRRHLKK